ncbi:dipeptidase [Microbacteriaceae bacterium 4G12]
MNIFDAHCDVLWQMWRQKQQISFADDSNLHITLQGLKQGKGKIQCFAIYVPEEVPHEARFDTALQMIHIFYDEIIAKYPEMKLILTKDDVNQLQDHEIGAILTLEGCEAIGHSLTRLTALYRLGVRSVGLTWNFSNAVADGALETRGAGLSLFGKDVVEELNKHRMWTDVSHLSERGFWDVMEQAHYPIASHSNVFALRPHPRNLKNEQIQALIQKDGMIGITFVTSFLKEEKPVYIDDVIRHLDYVCSLGGDKHVGFGSDFDGIVQTVVGLGRFEQYENLVNELLKRYKEEQVMDFLYRNFVNHIPF